MREPESHGGYNGSAAATTRRRQTPLRIVTAGLVAVSLSMVALVAASDRGKDNDRDRDRDNRISARLFGINEVRSVSTGATGRLKAAIA